MDYKSLIINKSALKRIFYIYIPLAAAIYFLLLGAAWLTDKPPSPPLALEQSFDGKLPIVYDENYNMGFFGLENLHHFDTAKYRKIHDALVAAQAVKPEQFIPAAIPDRKMLEIAQTPEYLDSLSSSVTLARIIEVNVLKFFPSHLSNNLILQPMLYQTGGSLLAARAALKSGWAINLGGGFHHAARDKGEGFCALADISLIVKYLRQEKLAQKIMIVDFDAHQGNGFGRDFIGDSDVFIVDAYNKDVYPNDIDAKRGIDVAVELDAFTGDTEYLQKLRKGLDRAFAEFTPDFIIYNAGTDILAGDPLGALDISPKGVAARDELVFSKALDAKIPVVMLLSGGYQKTNAQVISDSILNLKDKFKIF